MDGSLQQNPIPESLQTALADSLFRSCRGENQLGVDLSIFFKHYSVTCQRFLVDCGIYVSAKTHGDLCAIAQLVLQGQDKAQVRRAILAQANIPEAAEDPVKRVDASINLTATILFMVEIGRPENVYSGNNAIIWEDKRSIAEVMASYFVTQTQLSVDSQRIGKIFTAKSLCQIGDFNIRWTFNLVDHLLLADDEKTLSIFCCPSFLRFQERYGKRLPSFKCFSSANVPRYA